MLFGSAVRADFGKESDLDLLVEFDPDARIGFLDLSRLQRELSSLAGRRVDLVPKLGLKPAIRAEILGQARLLYAELRQQVAAILKREPQPEA